MTGVSLTPVQAQTIRIISQEQSDQEQAEVSRAEVFNFFAESVSDAIPDSYQYIHLNYSDIDPQDSNYEVLQKLVYIDLISNNSQNLYLEKKLPAYVTYSLAAKLFSTDISYFTTQSAKDLKWRNTLQKDLTDLSDIMTGKSKVIPASSDLNELTETSNKAQFKKQVFIDVYDTLIEEHYDKEEFGEEQIIDAAIQGLTHGTKDKHTVYFPPIESQNFSQALSGEYEWIGAYVDMPRPGVFEILSPISGSPSQAAGLKGWDRVTHIDGKAITAEHWLDEVVSWIKWPAGSSVVLTILRDGVSQDISVTRAKIVIKDIEYTKLNSATAYIEMKSFGEHSAEEFEDILEEIASDVNVKKIIFDLRNNGGGYLNQVSNMLSHFIEKWEPVAVVKNLDYNQYLNSRWYATLDLSKYNVVFLQNSGTASASEILIGTIKDYYPDTQILWEQSYGKWSVQTTKQYKDGSILKYTIARWYTGKTQTGIDGVWITPDIELLFDIERFNKNKYDNQLEAAKKLQY